MNLKVIPSTYLKGTIKSPPSKSYSIRAFIVASLGGKSKIVNPSNSIDSQVAISNCRKLGAKIKKAGANLYSVTGFDKNNQSKRVLDVKESGTTLRFLISLASLFPGKTTILGRGTLKTRPNKPLIDTLKKLGLKIKGNGRNEAVPIIIEGKQLKGAAIKIDGTLSSQFISSLLITCANFTSNTHLTITGNSIVSLPYIDMTILTLKKAGVRIRKINRRKYLIYGNQKFKGLGKFIVPPDYGLSAFFMAAASLIKSGVFIEGLGLDSFVQADKKILYCLRKMGVRFAMRKTGLSVKGPFSLKGNNFSLKDAPDLIPVLGILALFANTKTRLCGIKHARIKESNRISTFRDELIKLGAKVKEKEDELIIYPCRSLKSNVILNPHNDHRLAMAFCILGLVVGTRVKNVECISKSYPDFLRDLKKIGGKFTKN